MDLVCLYWIFGRPVCNLFVFYGFSAALLRVSFVKNPEKDAESNERSKQTRLSISFLWDSLSALIIIVLEIMGLQ